MTLHSELKIVSSGVTYCRHNLYLRGCSKSEIEEHLRECFGKEEGRKVPA